MGYTPPWKFAQWAILILLELEPAAARAGGPSDQAPPIPVSGLSGITFLTADLAETRRFYAQGAGLAELSLGPDSIRFEVGERQWIEFQRVPKADWARRLQYATFEAADVDQVARDLRSRGIATDWIGSDPRSRILQLVDPAGNTIRVAEPWVFRSPTAERTVPFSDHLQHIGFAVPSSLAAAMTAFYEDKLGFREVVRMNTKNGKPGLMKFRLPGPNNDVIELIFFEPPLNKWAAGAFDHVDFEVSDMDATYRQLHKGGIATKSSHLPTVNGEHLWAIDIIDPELTRMEVQVAAPTSVPVGTVSAVGGESARPLFNGRTLEGWEGNLGNWRAEDGAIVAGALDRRQPHNEFLMTTADFGDFELRLQYKVEGTGGFVNGGVQFWSQRVPASFEVSGYQADLGADTDGNLYDESRRSVNLATAPAEVRLLALKPGAWNDYRIRAQGAHIEIWLNGHKTVDYTESDKSVALHGRFALQIHGGANTKVSYRALEVEAIPASSPPP
jgi:catechol 2,3-dioxygenase-like lactoylglutathione lyase family enzyme